MRFISIYCSKYTRHTAWQNAVFLNVTAGGACGEQWALKRWNTGKCQKPSALNTWEHLDKSKVCTYVITS